MKKQILLFFLALLPMVAKADESGTCGDNLTWHFETATNTLTISGTGKMENFEYTYYSSNCPWYTYSHQISTVRIANGVKSIGNYAFRSCSSLSSITIPNSVTSIGELAFSNCYSLTSITIPNGVTCIGANAFSGCYSLTSITVSNNVTSIGNYAFYGCSDLTSITIPNSVTSIGDYAFAGCTSLTAITIPNSVTSIGEGAFRECYNMTTVTIPNSVTSIGEGTFLGCSSLNSITIPNSVTNIGNFAFCNCFGLASIIVESGNCVYDSRSDCNAIIKTGTNELIVGCKNTIIPNSVTSIGDYAFYECSSLTTITIPYNVTTIGDYAFGMCSGLTSITIHNGVTSIGDFAFANCFSLSSVTIPNSVTSIGDYAFEYCSGLTSIIISNSVTSIGDYAFEGCTDLTTVTVEWKDPISITSYTFSNRANASLYVPFGCKAAYETDDYWKEFKEIIEMSVPSPTIVFADANVKAICVANWDTNGDGELSEAEAAAVNTLGEVFKENTAITSFNELKYFTGLTIINDNAFRECTSLTSIAIPSGVTAIEICAFYGCNKLETISIPEGVTTSSGYAFMGCSSLASLTLPCSVASIVYDAFNGCSSLASINIPENVTFIDNGTFSGCSSLTSVVIPAGVTSLGASSFYGCTSLKTVNIPDGVKIIGINLFCGCSSLTSIDIPYDVRIIGGKAFEGCNSLTSIKIPSLVNTIGASAFAGCNNLSMVTVENNTPIEITEDVFSNRANATLYVPFGSKAAYMAANYWKEFKKIVEIIDPDTEDTDFSTLDNTIYINKVEVYSGTEATLSIQMKNTAAIRGFQFDLYLPEGVTVVKNDKGRIQAALNKSRVETEDEHTLTCSEQEDGAIRFLCGSQYEETFTSNDGEIATLQVIISASVEDGEYPLLLRDIKLSETDINKYYEVPLVKTTLTVSSYMPGDINADAKVDVSDYIGVANHILGHTPEGFVEPAGDVDNNGVIDISDYLGIGNIIHTGSVYGSYKVKKQTNLASELSTMDNVIYVSNITVNAGGTATLSLCMKNSASIRGFQFDLYLPEGITAAVNNKGRIIAALTNVRLEEGDEHTLTTSQQEDGCIRFLCGSQYEENFTGSDGEIATLTINVDAEMLAGDYPILLKNMKLSESDIRNYYETEQVDSIISVVTTTGIVLTDEVNNLPKDCYYNLAGQRVISTKKGVYIHHGRKIIVK